MAFIFILLVLPEIALAKGRINVEILGKYSGDANDLKVHGEGMNSDTVSDTEITTFNVTENNLKNAVNACFGKRPDRVFVRSPTPWDDLYSKYSWDQVSRGLLPINGRIFLASSVPILVVNHTFENNSTKPVIFNVGISQTVVNTVWSWWETSGELSVDKNKINYLIKINVSNVGGQPYFNYTSSWGQQTQQSQAVTVGASSNMDITLLPGEAVIARLEASRGFVQGEMEYEASLSGKMAVYYNDPYQGHNFYGLLIRTCMDSIGLSNKKTSREFFNIRFFSDSKVVVSDLRSGRILMELH